MPSESSDGTRRTFLGSLSTAAMAGGLAASYGTLAYMAGRFLYPRGDGGKQWFFALVSSDLAPGDSRPFRVPDGASITIARRDDTGTAEDFIALSSTCPHLGCKVHWEAQNNRFFCPCHNGAFDPDGKATQGPPKDANQSLSRYPLKLENGLLYILAPSKGLPSGQARLSSSPGHDPCLEGKPGPRRNA